MSIPNPSHRRWFQFSLRSLLLVTTFAALILACVISLRRAREAEQEVRLLRRETGHLVVEDPTKAYVKKVATSESMTWHWKLYLPEGRKYQIHSKLGAIPRVGLETSSAHSMSLDPGLHRITVSLHRSYVNEWEWTMSTATRGTTHVVKDDDATWLPIRVSTGTAQAGAVEQVKWSPDESHELLRLICADEDGQVSKGGPDAAPAPTSTPIGHPNGILFWLAPEPMSK